jgi:hypothetical protein
MAQIVAKATPTQAMDTKIVMAEVTSLMGWLSSTSPIWIAATVRPELGKMKAHQVRSNRICFSPVRIASVETEKNQNPTSQRKMPIDEPRIFRTSPTGSDVLGNRPTGTILWARFPRTIRAKAV